jgi:hypothetical protein
MNFYLNPEGPAPLSVLLEGFYGAKYANEILNMTRRCHIGNIN